MADCNLGNKGFIDTKIIFHHDTQSQDILKNCMQRKQVSSGLGKSWDLCPWMLAWPCDLCQLWPCAALVTSVPVSKWCWPVGRKLDKTLKTSQLEIHNGETCCDEFASGSEHRGHGSGRADDQDWEGGGDQVPAVQDAGGALQPGQGQAGQGGSPWGRQHCVSSGGMVGQCNLEGKQIFRHLVLFLDFS